MTEFHVDPSRPSSSKSAILTAAVLALAASASVAAAEIPLGQWTGTIMPPEGVAAPATFTVGEADGQIQISVAVAGMTLPFRDIEVTDETIAFVWTPGPDVSCTLELQEDNSFSGPCTDTNGDTGSITMVPPDQRAEGLR